MGLRCARDFFCLVGLISLLSGQVRANETINYSYDSLERLSQVSRAGTVNNGFQSAYCYDPAANRQSVTTVNNGNLTSPCATSSPALPTISIGSVVGIDGNTVSFPVTLSNASSSTVSVHYLTANGSAVSGTDYVAQNSNLTFSPGVMSQVISVSTIDRGGADGNIAFTMNLSAPTGAVVGTAVGTATLSDPSVSLPTLSIGNAAGIDGTFVSFPVTLSAASSSAISVDYATANGTAVAGTDYVTTSGTLVFSAGVTSQTIAVQTMDRGSNDGSLQFTLALSSPAGASIANGIGTATISDPAPVGPTISIGNVTGKDGNVFNFIVTLSAASSSTVTVGYSTANGTALAPTDYTARSGTLTFAAGVTSQTIAITTLNSGATDSGINFHVNLSGPTGGALGSAVGTGTMNDPIDVCCGTNSVTPAPTTTSAPPAPGTTG